MTPFRERGPYSEGRNRLVAVIDRGAIAPLVNASTLKTKKMACGCSGVNRASAGTMPNATLAIGQPANTAAPGLARTTTPVAAPVNGNGIVAALNKMPWWQWVLMGAGAYFIAKKVLG